MVPADNRRDIDLGATKGVFHIGKRMVETSPEIGAPIVWYNHPESGILIGIPKRDYEQGVAIYAWREFRPSADLNDAFMLLEVYKRGGANIKIEPQFNSDNWIVSLTDIRVAYSSLAKAICMAILSS